MVCGVAVTWWVKMFLCCTTERWTPSIRTRRGSRSVRYRERYVWPDGGSMMEQEACVLDAFDIMLAKCNEELARG